MDINELYSIRDNSGDYFEYEEYFRRVLLKIRETRIENKEIEKSLLEMLSEERSSAVIECTIKLLHSLDMEIPPGIVRPLIRIGDVLSTYSLYILDKNRKIEPSLKDIEEWKDLIRTSIESEIFLHYTTMEMISKLSSIPEIGCALDKAIEESKALSVNVLRLCTVFLEKNTYFYTGDTLLDRGSELERVFHEAVCLIGHSNTYLSNSASCFLLAYRKNIPNISDKEFYCNLRSVQNTDVFASGINSTDNYIRDIYVHLPQKKQAQLKEEIENNRIDRLSTVLDIPQKILQVSKKTIRYILTEHIKTEEASVERTLSLSDDYYKERDLSHLFTEKHTHHSECIEY